MVGPQCVSETEIETFSGRCITTTRAPASAQRCFAWLDRRERRDIIHNYNIVTLRFIYRILLLFIGGMYDVCNERLI